MSRMTTHNFSKTYERYVEYECVPKTFGVVSCEYVAKRKRTETKTTGKCTLRSV